MPLASAPLLAAHRSLARLHGALEPCVLRAHGQALRTSVSRRSTTSPNAGFVARSLTGASHALHQVVGEHLYYGSHITRQINRKWALLFGTGGAGFVLYPYRNPLGEVGPATSIARENNYAFAPEHQYGRLAVSLANMQNLVIDFDATRGWYWLEPSFGVAAIALASAMVGLVWRAELVCAGLAISVAHALLWHLKDGLWPQRRFPNNPPIAPPSTLEVHEILSARLRQRWHSWCAKQGGAAMLYDPSVAQNSSSDGEHPLMASISTLFGTNQQAVRRMLTDEALGVIHQMREVQRQRSLHQEMICEPWTSMLRHDKLEQRKLFGKLPHRVLDTEAFMLLVTDPKVTLATNHVDDPHRREMMWRLRYEETPVQWQTEDKSPIDTDTSLLGEPQLFIYMRPRTHRLVDGFAMRFFYDPSGVYRP